MWCCFRGEPVALEEAGDAVQPQPEKAPQNLEHGLKSYADAAQDVCAYPSKAAVDSLQGATPAAVPNGALSTCAGNTAEVWRNLVTSVRTNSAQQARAQPSFGVLLGASPPTLENLVRQSEGFNDPIALITFDHTTKRNMRTQRLSPHLLVDINLEALFAGGVVPQPPPSQHEREHTAAGVEFLDGGGSSGGGQLGPQALLHLLQSTYAKHEALRLSVQHGNAALLSLMGCSGASDYEGLLAELLSSEPALRAVLHDCCLCLLEGVSAPVTQLMLHHPVRGTPARVVLPVSIRPVIVWRRAAHSAPSGGGSGGGGPGPGAAAAAAHALGLHVAAGGGAGGGGGPDGDYVPTLAVAISYNLSAGMAATLQQLHRVYAMLSSLSGIVTLFTLRGRVLHQNTASIRYMGLRQGLEQPATLAGMRDSTHPEAIIDDSGLSVGSVLRQAFALSPEQLDDMLEDVAEGNTWKGIVRVPPLLTPTVDPGPAALHGGGFAGSSIAGPSLAGRGTVASTMMSLSPSQAQVLGVWERLGPGLMASQPGVARAIGAPAGCGPGRGGDGSGGGGGGNASDNEALSGIGHYASCIFMTQTNTDGGGTGDEGSIGQLLASRMLQAAQSGKPPPVPPMRGLHAAASPANATAITRENSDSLMAIMTASTSGGPLRQDSIRMESLRGGSLRGGQSSLARVGTPQRSLSRGVHDSPDAHSAEIAATLMPSPFKSPAVPSGLSPAGPTSAQQSLGSSAPVIRPTNHNSRAQSAVAAQALSGNVILSTLLENGATLMNGMDVICSANVSRSTSNVQHQQRSGGSIASSLNLATSGLGPMDIVAGGDGGDFGRASLTDAAKRQICRRRSALRLVPSTRDEDPLSTSTWGLMDGSRSRMDSKSFTSRRNPPQRSGTGDQQVSAAAAHASTGPHDHVGSAASPHLGVLGTSPSGLASYLGASGGAAASGSGANSPGNTSKRRPPSRLMSFLANKNIGGGSGGSGGGAGLATQPRSFSQQRSNVRSMPVVMSGGSVGNVANLAARVLAAGPVLPKFSSTTQVDMGGSDAPGAVGVPGLGCDGRGRSDPHAATVAVAGNAISCSQPSAAASAVISGVISGVDNGLASLPSPPSIAASAASAAVLPSPPSIAASAASAAVLPAATPSMRRPPPRRTLRPAVEDVVEEPAEPEAAIHQVTRGKVAFPAAAAATAATSVNPGILSHLSSVRGGGSSSAAAGSSVLPSAALPSAAALPSGVGAPCTPRLSAVQAAGMSAAGGGGCGGGRDENGSMGSEDDEDCWHEITASTLRDPVSGEQTLLLLQVDVTARVKAERRIAEVLEAEHKLLESVFPRHVLEMAAAQHTKPGRGLNGAGKFSLAEMPLAQNCASVATYHPMVTILFSDIIGFTSMCHEIPATKVMEFLNQLYSRLDTLLDVYGVYKVETIGDCYMVAGGLMTRDADGFMTVRASETVDELHAHKVMSFAKAMLRETSQILLPTTGRPVQMRIGLHSGPVMSGIVGSKMPRFCLFGDTVNTASRMESTCPPGSIHVSSSTRDTLRDEDWEATGGVEVKGKGMMQTYRWLSEGPESSAHAGKGSGRRTRRASSVSYLNNNNNSNSNSAFPGASSRDVSGPTFKPSLAGHLASGGLPSGGLIETAATDGLDVGVASLGSGKSGRTSRHRYGRAGSATFGWGLQPSQIQGDVPAGSQSGRPASGLHTQGFASGGVVRAGAPKRRPHKSSSTTALSYRRLPVRPPQ